MESINGAASLVRTITELGSFALLVSAVLLFFLRVLPRHFANQEKIASEMRHSLSEQRAAHSAERAYMRETQERQHQQNIDALNALSRAVLRLCDGQRVKRSDPDARPREG